MVRMEGEEGLVAANWTKTEWEEGSTSPLPT